MPVPDMQDLYLVFARISSVVNVLLLVFSDVVAYQVSGESSLDIFPGRGATSVNFLSHLGSQLLVHHLWLAQYLQLSKDRLIPFFETLMGLLESFSEVSSSVFRPCSLC